MKTLISVTEAAEAMNVSPSTIYRWIQGGVLSLLYFPDGRQAIDRAEVDRLAQSGENLVLYRLFRDVERALAQAVALLPSVDKVFAGPGWKGHAWPAHAWEEIRVMAAKQSEAHLDVGPFVPRRGRPLKGRVHRFTGEGFVNRFTGEPVL